MRKIIYYMWVACMAVWCTGCYEDKGNYDYTPVAEVVIDTTGLGIQEAYALTRFDVLEIAPNIYYDGRLVNDDSSAPLSYLWTIYAAATGSGIDYTVDTLGTSRILHAEITQVPSSYMIRLTVTNEENGLNTCFTVPCSVEGAVSEGGWLYLYEVAGRPGYSDVGQVVNSFTKRNLIRDVEYWNLYAASNGGPLEGSPVRISHTVSSLPNDLVVLVTDKNMVGVNKSSFATELTLGEFFYDAPETIDLSAYVQAGPGTTGEMLINNNQLYYRTGARTNLLGVPHIGDYGELAPWLCLYHRSFKAVVYDQTNQCFLYVPLGSIELYPFVAQSPEAAFDVNNVGAELLMANWGRSNYEYFIMRRGSEYYLASANFYTTNTSSTIIGTGWYDMTSCPNMQNLSTMTASATGVFIYYGAGNSVYNFHYTTGAPAEAIWTAPSAGEEVVCVGLQKSDYSLLSIMLPNANSILHICTWNESTQEGKLYQYQINPASGALIGEPKVYTVPGKVKSMGWKYVLEM